MASLEIVVAGCQMPLHEAMIEANASYLPFAHRLLAEIEKLNKMKLDKKLEDLDKPHFDFLGDNIL